MNDREWGRFAEKVLLAVENSHKGDPQGGTSGLEVEFNVLDRSLAPVEMVGYGPESRSFADYLLDECLPKQTREHFQLEVFHWMVELTTTACFSAAATAAQARLLEGVMFDSLADVARSYSTTFLALHGNIPSQLDVSAASIPSGWNLARRRYLSRCVDLFGRRLATAGIHTNHSFPEALLSWDFFHLPLAQRKKLSLVEFRNQAVIRATRLLRPVCPVFIAVSAASPFDWEIVDGVPSVVMTEIDSQRLRAFPNPRDLDIPGLYASHEEYIRLSYELVRSGTRFGANNWTPVRARSDVDPVRRNIMATSEQLRELYRRGIYSAGAHRSLEEAERALVIENLCARVDLPMNRVEVRTDEGGDSLELATAKVLLKELLMLRNYGDPELGAGYQYDADDLERARANEDAAACRGLDAQIDHPFGEGKIKIRDMLGAILAELTPLATALGVREQLAPLDEMAAGGENPAAQLRAWVMDELGGEAARSTSGALLVPPEMLEHWFELRRVQVASEIRDISSSPARFGAEWSKMAGIIEELREMGEGDPLAPVRLSEPPEPLRISGAGDRTNAVLELAGQLIAIPSVTNCADERVAEVARCATVIADRLNRHGLAVQLFDRGVYPAIVAGFPDDGPARVTLCGHFDVVRPEPDDSQFTPRIQGDYLWGRGSADMKTVVASFVEWMGDAARSGPPYPPINLLLVGNEENGETEPFGTPHVLEALQHPTGWRPEFMIVGERTGEDGDELFGSVCIESRGIARLKIIARGRCGHTGTGAVPGDLLDRLIEIRSVLDSVFSRHLTLSSHDGWETSARFPFLNVGEPGVYNITAGIGTLGVEIRPVPGDDLDGMVAEISAIVRELGLEVEIEVKEPGVACPSEDPYLERLKASVAKVSGSPATLGRKKPGSSARFAPGGRQVVWGQTGIGPHSREERHFIPSIAPYLEILDVFARSLTGDRPPGRR